MSVDVERLICDLKRELSPKRLAHTFGCADTARRLASKLDADADSAYTAGLLHDITREKSLSEQLIICAKYGIIINEYERDSTALLHAATGAAIAYHEYGASEEIRRAISLHTTGGARMKALDISLCLADYIEPTRSFPGVEDLRRAAENDPRRALLKAFDKTIIHIIEQCGILHPETVTARNDLLKQFMT